MKESRWKKCSHRTTRTFGVAAGRLFVREAFDEESKEKVSPKLSVVIIHVSMPLRNFSTQSCRSCGTVCFVVIIKIPVIRIIFSARLDTFHCLQIT